MSRYDGELYDKLTGEVYDEVPYKEVGEERRGVKGDMQCSSDEERWRQNHQLKLRMEANLQKACDKLLNAAYFHGVYERTGKLRTGVTTSPLDHWLRHLTAELETIVVHNKEMASKISSHVTVDYGYARRQFYMLDILAKGSERSNGEQQMMVKHLQAAFGKYLQANTNTGKASAAAGVGKGSQMPKLTYAQLESLAGVIVRRFKLVTIGRKAGQYRRMLLQATGEQASSGVVPTDVAEEAKAATLPPHVVPDGCDGDDVDAAKARAATAGVPAGRR